MSNQDKLLFLSTIPFLPWFIRNLSRSSQIYFILLVCLKITLKLSLFNALKFRHEFSFLHFFWV
jgi:hypothetical protein